MSKKQSVEEFQTLPFRGVVNIEKEVNDFKESLKDLVDFKENQTVTVYPNIEDGKLYLRAITTNLKGEDVSFMDFQEAVNKWGF